jgi:type IV pilus assembly protein PilB
LRQDPDIILVGEIRDKETAQLAIQAALTGHLVLSTIHTNNAIGVIPRLVDMGVDPYLIAPTLKLAVAQRLARRICPDSGTPIEMSGTVSQMMDEAFASLPKQHHSRIPTDGQMLKLQPTDTCPSGTRGRIAVTECLEVTDEIEQLILENASEEDIYNAARQRGFMSMQEDAIIKALNRQIPFEEVGTFGTKVGVEDIPLVESQENSVSNVSPEGVNLDDAAPVTSPPSSSTPVDNLSLDDVRPL